MCENLLSLSGLSLLDGSDQTRDTTDIYPPQIITMWTPRTPQSNPATGSWKSCFPNKPLINGWREHNETRKEDEIVICYELWRVQTRHRSTRSCPVLSNQLCGRKSSHSEWRSGQRCTCEKKLPKQTVFTGHQIYKNITKVRMQAHCLLQYRARWSSF